MSHLDSFHSLVAGDTGPGGSHVRDVSGELRPTTAEEVLEAARIAMSRKFRRGSTFKSPKVVKHYLRAKLSQRELEVFALFGQFSGPIRTLIENKCVYQPFWTAQQAWDSSEAWRDGFEAGKRAALRALMEKDTVLVLSIVFDRLYVLRNQLVHGGATWNSGVNRQQARDGVAILGSLLPIVLDLMTAHPDADHGGILYPVVS